MRILKAGTTSQSLYIDVLDSTSTTGGRKTGLAYNTSSLVAYYARNGAAATAITLVTQTATGAWSSGGFVEVDATNMPGIYRLDIPDAAIAAGVPSVVVILKGATGMVQVSLEIQLVAVDHQDAVRFGLTALPNAAAEAAGGLYTRGSGAGQINQDANGRIDANVKTWIGGAIPAVNVTGVPIVDNKYLLGTVYATPATAGIPDVNVKNMNNVAATPITTIKAVQGLATDGVVPTVTTVTNQLTAAQIATGVWTDTTAGDFTVANSIGKSIMNGVSLGTALTIGAVSGAVGSITGITFPTNFASLVIDSTGRVNAFLIGILTTVFTEGATGRIAAGFKQFFNIATPAATMDHGILVDTVTTLTTTPSDSSGVTTLLGRLTSARAGYLDVLNGIVAAIWAAVTDSSGVTTLLTRVSASRAGYLDNLNVGGNVASSAEATAIQNNTRVVRVVPEIVERPDSGPQTYRIELFLYDDVGNMEAPDSAPTITLVNQAGTDRSSRLDSTTMALVSTGRYRAIYTASVGDTLEQLVWAFSVVEGGATRLYGNQSVIVDTTAVDFTSADRAKLDTLHDTRIPGVIQPQTGDAYARLGAPVGASVSADIAAVKGDTAGIKTKTDQITFTNANKVDSTAITVSDKTGYALTSAYDPAKTAAQAGDAMALTSGERTTLTASIWNALTSGLTTAGSIGKWIVDKLDVVLSTRLATSGYTAPDNTSITAIKAKTDNLPASPAAVGSAMTLAADSVTAAALATSAVNEIVAGISVPTAATIAGAVLNEPVASHTTAGSLGQTLSEMSDDLDTIEVQTEFVYGQLGGNPAQPVTRVPGSVTWGSKELTVTGDGETSAVITRIT